MFGQYRARSARECGVSATAEYDRKGGEIEGSRWVFMRSEEEEDLIVIAMFTVESRKAATRAYRSQVGANTVEITRSVVNGFSS
jgi:hypothetical protein